MNIVQRLKDVIASPPLGEDGEPAMVELAPPASAEEIGKLEAQLGAPLSPSCRELLKFCGGWDEGSMEPTSFLGEDFGFDPVSGVNGERLKVLCSHSLGNSWFYWSSALTPDLGPVFYHQHEVPLILLQSQSLIEFVEESLAAITPPYRSKVGDFGEFRIRPIRELNNDLIERDVAIDTGDDALKTFARAQSVGSWLYDFRRAKAGDGVNLEALDVIGMHDRLPILALSRGRGAFARFFLGRRKMGSRQST